MSSTKSPQSGRLPVSHSVTSRTAFSAPLRGYVMTIDSGGSRISPRRERQHSRGRQHRSTILPNFTKNCMKLKEFGPPGGASPKFYYVDPPLIDFSIDRLKGGPSPYRSNFLSFYRIFQKNLKNMLGRHLPLGVGAPSSKKFWIRPWCHCKCVILMDLVNKKSNP